MISSGLIGFVVGLTPFACNLMGWRGTAVGPSTGAANMCVTRLEFFSAVTHPQYTDVLQR